MPVFYRGPRAVVTHDFVEVPCAARRRLAIGGLSAVHIVLDESGRAYAGNPALGVSALVAAAATIPVVGPASVPLAATVLCGLCACAALCLRGRSRQRWQVRATYQGQLIEVFRSTDEREFAEFCRGLVRSLEFHDPGR